MNQVKAGKLIAKLRKEKGLTQSELGEMVGVGDRAVSKWERGITFPNVAIINELSEILGISSNELLDGEIYSDDTNSKNKKSRFNKKYLFVPLILIFIFAVILLIIMHSKSYVYTLRSENSDFLVEGNVIYSKKSIYVNIDSLSLMSRENRNIIIKNYEYTIYCKTDFIFKKGYLGEYDSLDSPISIESFFETFKITFSNSNTISRQQLEANGLTLNIVFINEKEETISHNIEMSLHN